MAAKPHSTMNTATIENASSIRLAGVRPARTNAKESFARQSTTIVSIWPT